MAICGVLGWRCMPFLRWPIAIIIFALIGGLAMVTALHHDGADPALDGKLMRVAICLKLLPAAVYWLLYGLRAGLDRWRSRTSPRSPSLPRA